MTAATTLEREGTSTRETPLWEPETTPEANSGLAGEDAGSKLERRVRKAAALYLERKGYEILAHAWPGDPGVAGLVCQDEYGAIVFAEVLTAFDGFPAEDQTEARRARFEAAAIAYLAEHDITDVPVRFDTVCIVPVAQGRAILRHHINAFSDN